MLLLFTPAVPLTIPASIISFLDPVEETGYTDKLDLPLYSSFLGIVVSSVLLLEALVGIWELNACRAYVQVLSFGFPPDVIHLSGRK